MSYLKRHIVLTSLAIMCLGGGGNAHPEETSPKIEFLEENAVTPFGFSAPAWDFPGNISIIDEKAIARSNAKHIYELLRREPGIFVSDYTQAGKTVTVDMRGFGDTAGRNLLVMVDGRRVNEIDISGTDWSQIPIENVERIEVLRGAGSVLYGDNAAAGVVNIITKQGKKGHHLEGGADFGSFRYQNFRCQASGDEGPVNYNVFSKRSKTDGYRLNGDYDGYDLDASFEVRPADILNIALQGGYHKDWYGLPAGLQRWEIDQIGRRGSTTPNDRAKTETTFFRITPTIFLDVENIENSLALDVWGRKKRLDTTTWDYLWGGGATWDNSQIDSKGGSVKYINALYLFEARNTFTAGIDAFSAENRLLTVTPAWLTYNQLKIRKKTFGLYVNDKAEVFEKFIVSSGYRYEWADYVFDQSENAGRYETKRPGEYAFDAGVEYKYLDRGSIYGRYSRSYRFPATDEFYSRWSGLNTELKPQAGDTWEIGMRDRHCQWFQPGVNFFWMTSDNEIFYDPSLGAFGENRNYGRINRFGIESDVRSQPFKWLDIYAAYSYIDAEFGDGNFAGRKVPLVPEHKLTSGMTLSLFDLVALNLDAEYLSSQYSINDENNTLPVLKGRFVANCKLSFKYKEAEIFLGINNVFDQKYSEYAVSNVSGTATDQYPAPSRNYVFGVSMRI
ncbi:MAG: TonB-dependent receptor [Candidatus Omnitrophica bacterium]|nr:TonB-dependent receptor [Candidatus Omnitrophota bacterium]